jgi:hypothetical protein
MANYRIYVLDGEERIAVMVERDIESDADAAQAAEILRGNRSAAEVWRGADLVSRTGAVFTPFNEPSSLRSSSQRRS